MKKIFNKVLAGITSVALVATLFVGVAVDKTVEAADTVTLTPWSFYEGAASFRNGEDPWAQRFYKSVTTSAGETLTGWGTPEAGTTEMTQATTKVADGFTADILTTGWDGDYEVTPTGDNPYMLRAEMFDIPVIEGHDYTITFNVEWINGSTTEKNVKVGIANPYESVFTNDPDAVTDIVVKSGSVTTYTQDFTVWAGTDIDVSIAYGCFLKKINDGVTTETTDASGTIKVTALTITDNGENKDYVAPPEPDVPTETAPNNDTTTKAPEATTKAPTTTVAPTTKAPTVKKLAQVKKVKAKNNKKKALTISWKKVKNAKKYQVKVGSKSYNTSKVKLVVKKLKKGKKYTVRVRAKASGYKTGAWSKKVKVKIKK